MATLTDKQTLVLDTLRSLYKEHQRPIGPTEIGLALGYSYNTASSLVSPALKRMIGMQLAKRMPGGKYIPIQDDEQ